MIIHERYQPKTVQITGTKYHQHEDVVIVFCSKKFGACSQARLNNLGCCKSYYKGTCDSHLAYMEYLKVTGRIK